MRIDLEAPGVATSREEHEPRTVPCRECGAPCLIAGDVVGLAVSLSNYARSRGWEPLKASEVTACDDCRAEIEAVWLARCGQARGILGEMDRASREGRSFQAILMNAPTWFRDEYRAEINGVAKRAEERRTAKPETSKRGKR